MTLVSLLFLVALKPLFVLPGQDVWLPDVSEQESLPQGFTPGQYQYIYQLYLPQHRITKGYKHYRAQQRPGFKKVSFMAGTDTALVITMLPYDSLVDGAINGYVLGKYPDPHKTGKGVVAAHIDSYLPPKGFIEITPEIETLHVSEHFVIGDFSRRWERGVYPRYIVLDPRVPQVLEAVMDSLESMGLPSQLKILSGYRSPLVNRRKGRKRWSQHQYGRACDFYVDGDNNNRMDDLNGDGRSNRKDAKFLADIAEKVLQDMGIEGGIGYYRGRRQGTPFIHVDVRGFRARWKR